MLYLRYSECASGITGQTIVTKSITVGSEQRMEQESKVSITCTEKQTDQAFTIITSNGTSIDATYSCTPPQSVYSGELVGWIPEFVISYIAEVSESTQAFNESTRSPRLVRLSNYTDDINELNNNPTTQRRLLSQLDEMTELRRQELQYGTKHGRMMTHLKHYQKMFDTHGLHPGNADEPSAYDTERERQENVLAEVIRDMAKNGDIDPANELQRLFRDTVMKLREEMKTPQGRRLLEEDEEGSDGGITDLEIIAVSTLGSAGLTAGIAAASPAAGAIFAGAIAGVALGLATSNRVIIEEILNRLDGLDDAVAELRQSVSDATDARAELSARLKRKDKQVSDLFANITTTFSNVNQLIVTTNTLTLDAKGIIDVNSNGLLLLKQEASANFTAMLGVVDGVAELVLSQADELIALESGMTSIEQRIARTISNTTRDATTAREEMATKIIDSISDVSADVRFNLKAIKVLANVITDENSNLDTRRKFAIMLQQTIESMKSIQLDDNSLVYEFQPFSRNAGIGAHQPGDDLYEQYTYFPMDEVTIVHRGWDISQQPLANTRIYQDTYVMNCRTETVVGKTAFAYDWEDMITAVGPPGCIPQNNPTAGNTTTDCECFIDRTRYYCDVAPGAGGSDLYDADPTLLDDFVSFGESGTPAGCTVVEQDDVPEPIIRDVNDLYAALFEVCVIGDYDNGFNIQSSVLKSGVTDVDSHHTTTCKQPTNGIVDDFWSTTEKQVAVQGLITADDGLNIVESFFDMFVVSKSFQFRRDVEWEHNHWGQIPRDVHFDTIPFNDGNEESQYTTGESQYATMVFTNPIDPATGDPAPYIPIYNFEHVLVESTISVTVNGVTTTTSDIQTTNAYSNLLVPQMTFFGNPYKIIESGLTSYVFDVRQGDDSTSRVAKEREGSVTYMMIRADEDDSEFVPTDKFHDAASWLAENPTTIFDASAATNSLHLHARTIVEDPSVPNKYQCVNSRAEDGILCQIFDHFRVEAPIDTVPGSDTRIILTADEFVTQGTIDVPVGELIVNVISDCLPTASSLEISTNLFTKRVSFNNPTSSISEVCMHTYNPHNPEDPQCNRYTYVSVPGGSTATLSFPRCSSNTTVSNDLTLKQYLLDTDSGCSEASTQTQTVCNVDGTPIALGSDEIVKSDIPQVSVIREEAYVVNEVTARRLSEALELFGTAMNTQSNLNSIFMAASGVDFSGFANLDTGVTRAMANQSMTLADDLRSDLATIGTTIFNETDYVRDLVGLNDAFTTTLDDWQDDEDQVLSDIENQEVRNALLNNITSQIADARDADDAGYENVLTQMTDIFQDISDIGDIPRLDIGSIPDGFGKVMGSIVNGVIDLVEEAVDQGKGLFDVFGGVFGGIFDFLVKILIVGSIAFGLFKLYQYYKKNDYSEVDADAMKEMQRDIRELQVEFGKIRDDLDKINDSIAELGRTMKQLNVTKYKQSFSLAKRV